jgi:hypothetical protein
MKFKVGFPDYGNEHLTRKDLNRMNFGQIQVIVNDLCNQIESKMEIFS